MTMLPKGATAHKLDREFPSFSRPKSAPDDPRYVAELAATLGDFVLWLHDQWPALIDRHDALEAKIERVEGHLAYLVDKVDDMHGHIKTMAEQIAKMHGGKSGQET